MSSAFNGLSIAISGLYANKKALDTTGHNMANADNKTYTRQSVTHASSTYHAKGGSFKMGTGVNVQQIRQIRDEFLDMRFRDHMEGYGYSQARSDVFMQVQEITNDISGEGLQDTLNAFWNSWDELSKSPENLTYRGLVKENGIRFVDTVNHLDSQLGELQRNLNEKIISTVSEVNQLAKDIATCNRKIMGKEVSGYMLNDYYDARNAAIDKLSEIVGVETYETKSGALNVKVGGLHIVENGNSRQMATKKNQTTFVDIYWQEAGFTELNDKVNLTGGTLAGLVEGRGDIENDILENGNGVADTRVGVAFLYDETITGMKELAYNYKTSIKELDLKEDLVKEDQSFEIEDVSSLISYLKGVNFKENENKKVVIVTEKDINVQSKIAIAQLQKMGVSVTVVAPKDSNWKTVTDATFGKFISLEDFKEGDLEAQREVATDLALETSASTSLQMGTLKDYVSIIPNIRQKLNTLVNTVGRMVNYYHRQGFTLDGQKGGDFFQTMNDSLPLQAGNIRIGDSLESIGNIAAGSIGFESGNGEIANKIKNLRGEKIFETFTVDEYYRSIISELGSAAHQTELDKNSTKVLADQVNDKRVSISGVSLDEEMSDMMKYQHSYLASTRVVNAIDEMLNKIINGTGRVGL